MKLLLDMNLSPLWVATLAEAGFETVHWSSVGMANTLDPNIMQYAERNGYAVCTQDLDFGIILAATGNDRPSVVQIRADRALPQQIGIQVVAALLRFETELEAGALVTIDPKKTRGRVLPLGIQE
jgi:predicted nuclease of predicted toxin-antitoxin system